MSWSQLAHLHFKGFGKVLGLYYIVHFGNHIEISVPNSIAKKSLDGAKHVSGASLHSRFIRNVSIFPTNCYPTLFVSLEYIYLHHMLKYNTNLKSLLTHGLTLWL